MPESTSASSSNAAAKWRERRRNLRKRKQEEDDYGLNDTGNDNNNNDDDLVMLAKTMNTDSLDISNVNKKYVPHISAAKRLRMEREAALRSAHNSGGHPNISAVNDDDNTSSDEERGRTNANANTTKTEGDGNTNDDDNTEGIKKEENDEAKQEQHENDQNDESNAQSLLAQATALRHALTSSEREALAKKEEENRILKEASKVQTNALQAASELAQGVVYTESLPTSWTCPGHILDQGETAWNKTRKNWHILVEGYDCPPPMKSFGDMKFPQPILNYLKGKNIRRPTPIQMQGLPVALAGRDMVGIAFTGSGKTMTFSLPLVMAALEEEIRMPLVGGEGPVGIILAPSRELVRQTFDLVKNLCETLHRNGYPKLRSQLVIGGENGREQLRPFQEEGIHCVVATPGRLRDFLKKKSITLDICRYICLDEADRMLDLGFDEEVGEIMNFFKHQRQTLLFSATFPKKFQDFAKQTLIKPLVVNVGRAGAANLDVIQEVEYVKQEAKIVYLLECLQKTAPPVIIFCERKGDVDDIHEYLLLKGVEAVSIHGGKDQSERNEAIQLYKDGKKDVLVATDIAAKGLDFADIQHVINFDMPTEIENYVHRIGRTGRCGKTGVATTFINKSCEETTLLDLKHLLKEAHQRIPPVLMIMDDPMENVERGDGTKGCSFCGGLGHSIVDCPKIDKDARRVTRKDALASGDGYGGEI
jgi:ATP-dependent RNA helicase DDX41